jgi:phage terminase large subunit-like protein
MSNMSQFSEQKISIGRMHTGQVKAYLAFQGHRFKALRCGRRFGKTDFAKIWIADGLVRGMECAWFAPQVNTWSEVFSAMADTLRPILEQASKSAAVMRTKNGGRLDFWTLGNSIAGRGRRYHRIVIDEAAFAKDGDNQLDNSMMGLWEKAIKPTLYDFDGQVLVCSNSAGKNPDNFFYNICTDSKYGFKEYHAPTHDNPLLPKRLPGEGEADWAERRKQVLADLIKDNDPRVYEQEYLGGFVDWAGVGFFDREKLLEQGQPVGYPIGCDGVFAVIDTASKTGTDNDGTAVTFFARDARGRYPLMILDWDLVQIDGALLEMWLPSIFERLEKLARLCGARRGSVGAWIEDKDSGTILLQQAQRRKMSARRIDSKLTAMGKDERAFSVSGYVHQAKVKYTAHAFNKTAVYKQKSRNHLMEQIESFRIGDKDGKREDDLLDTFCYGVALALGNSEGF